MRRAAALAARPGRCCYLTGSLLLAKMQGRPPTATGCGVASLSGGCGVTYLGPVCDWQMRT